jgi:hypothetical protein
VHTDVPCSCNGNNCGCKFEPVVKIEREFIITGFAKPIIVRDMRDGEDDESLEELGVIERLLGGLTPNALNPVLGRNLVIAVEETTEYTRLRAYSGNRLGVRFDYILTDDEHLADRLESQLGAMFGMAPDPICECDGKEILPGQVNDCKADGCSAVEIPGVVVEGIAVTNREGIVAGDFDTMVIRFTTAFNHASISNTQRAYIKANIKEVKIIPNAGGDITILNGIFTIIEGSGATGIRGVLLDWLESIPPVCECEVKEHLGIGEVCGCGFDDCECTLKVYGTLANGVKIFRSGELSDAEMDIAVANAIAAYADLTPLQKTQLEGKIDEIHISPLTLSPSASYIMKDGKKVLTYRHNRSSTGVATLLSDIGSGVLVIVQAD